MGSTLDDALRALANPERRQVLIALAKYTPQADDALHVPEDVLIGGQERDPLYTQLYHIHLPILEAAGLIHWDQNAQQVKKGPQFDTFQPVLNSIQDSTATPIFHE